MVLPSVSVLIPARNEERDIGACIDAIAGQLYPTELIEVLVIDGSSSDATATRAAAALAGTRMDGRVLSNPTGSTPSSLNAGLAGAKGDLICRVDARSIVQPDHLAVCAEILSHRPEIVVVGGAQVATPRPGSGVAARGIARALQNPWATGFARYRRRSSSGPADTVYLGAFRAAQLRDAGGWDERFETNQDFELNRRLAADGLVWFDDRLATIYRPRETYAELWRQHRRFGRWKAAAWLEYGLGVQLRQVALVVGPPAALLFIRRLIKRGRVTELAVGALVASAALDAAAGDPSPPPDRVAAGVAWGVLGAGWWCGVAEQVLRFARGERLLT